MHKRPARGPAPPVLFLLFLFLTARPGAAQPETPPTEALELSVARIMQDPASWIGDWPGNPYWTEDGTLYFSWNPQGQFPDDSLFKVDASGAPVRVGQDEQRGMPPRFDGWQHGAYVYDAPFERRVYTRDGDLYVYNRSARATTRLTATSDRELDPRFTPDGQGIVYRRDNNLFKLDLASGLITQLTDVRSGNEPEEEKDPDDQDAFLRQQQQDLFAVLRERRAEREEREEARERAREAERELPSPVYTGKERVLDLRIDPAERYVAMRLGTFATNGKQTIVQDYVTESGYAEDRNARPKVGTDANPTTLKIQDLVRDTLYAIDWTALPGAYDVPAFRREQGVEVDSSRARVLAPTAALWTPDGRYLVVEVRAYDNKDRWIVRIDPETAALTVLDRQHDEAWVAGPGIRRGLLPGTMGWTADGRRLYFLSEATGYSHLYTVDVESGAVRTLTSGAFEIFSPMLSRDGDTWFFTSSEGSPFERHFYRMPAAGGGRTRLTTMEGGNEVALAPDEQTMGILHSYSNRPPEVYVQPFARPPQRITDSPTEEWRSYPWRDPEIIRFEASDGADVPARLYEPETPNGAAVLFVHGAGYQQNVHRWWSSYFREYMFHNLLADLGYVVLDVDYRASEGYGRDWRTAIYRHMGGRDLQDFVDASRHLQRTRGIPAERIGIYGGSYGGFITLMALFTEAEHFGAGAALRSVTDWAHYNHWYTSAILNTPVEDSLAYARSSPIYFAEGLEDPLLIAHGVVDTNVQFQDVARLAQRLIELGKENWEMAIYPVEGHGFDEPTSWTDEYRRILKLFEDTLHPNEEETEAAGGG